MKHIKVVIYVL